MKFKNALVSDEELVKIMKADIRSQDAFNELVGRYSPYINYKARFYFIAGSQREDLIQEARIALFNAVHAYNEEKETSFYTFATLCINRHIITCVRNANTLKQTILTNYYEFDTTTSSVCYDDIALQIGDSSTYGLPERSLLVNEVSEELRYVINNLLSEKEKIVINAYSEGKTYNEISIEQHLQLKEIDNALQRAKKKIKDYFESNF